MNVLLHPVGKRQELGQYFANVEGWALNDEGQGTTFVENSFNARKSVRDSSGYPTAQLCGARSRNG